MLNILRPFAVPFVIAQLWIGCSAPVQAQDQTIIMFAAASMKNALDEVNAAYTKKSGVKVISSYAASSALAKQIEAGAPADLFASADLEWMDYLDQGQHADELAGQSTGLDRTERFQNRQRDD